MKKAILVSLILILSSFLFISSLKAEETTTTINATTTTTTNETATLKETTTTTIVNTSDNLLSLWGRFWVRVRLILIPDPVKKAELSLVLTRDDLNRVVKANNEKALQKALDNYSKAIDALKTRLENLKNTSNNPNINTLLDKLTNLEVRHQELFDRLINNSTSTKLFLERVRQRLNQEIIPLQLRFENQEQFINRFEQQLKTFSATSTPVGEFHQLRIMESLKTQLQQLNQSDISTSTQQQLQRLQERLQNRIEQRLNILNKQGFSSSTVNEILNSMPQPTLKNKSITPPSKINHSTLTPSTIHRGKK